MTARPVVVLDACVLAPPGLRDLLLSCADAGCFRPIWQSRLLRETERTSVKLLVRRGMSASDAEVAARAITGQVRRAFPSAEVAGARWRPLVRLMTNEKDDRHVLAVAVAAEASHVVTANLRHFPRSSWPFGVQVEAPDDFLSKVAEDQPELAVQAVVKMAARHRNPSHSALELAALYASSGSVPTFGRKVTRLLQP